MRLDWILVSLGLNFHFLASKWHLIASKYPKFAVPWKWRFPAKPFYSQMQWAKKEMGLDSSQNLSKCSISSLKMTLNCLIVPEICCSFKVTISCKALFLKTISCIFSDTFTEHYWSRYIFIIRLHLYWTYSFFCLRVLLAQSVLQFQKIGAGHFHLSSVRGG